MKRLFTSMQHLFFVLLLQMGCQLSFLPIQLFAQENAIINLADPTVFYHNGMYYLYGTTGNGGEGFEVYTSTDQKNWNGPVGVNNGYALIKADVYGESGFWAPQVFYYNNQFYMAYTAEHNIAIATSNSPLGPFTQQVKTPLFQSGRNIDPFVFMDDNGKKYLYYVKERDLSGAGFQGNRIFVVEMQDDLSAILPQTDTECLRASSASGSWENSSMSIVEGPSVIKQGGKYYLIYSANAWSDINYAVGFASNNSATGTFSKFSGNPILKRQDINVNGPGHGDVYKDANDNWKYVFHTHFSNSVLTPRKTAIVEAAFTNGGQQFTINSPSYFYLKRSRYFDQGFNSSAN